MSGRASRLPCAFMTPSFVAAHHVESLRRFPPILRMLLADVSPDDARWRPGDSDWAIGEVVAHLADEEAEDFRPRLQSTLDDPTRTWKPIDPEQTAIDRAYLQRDLATEVDRFCTERAKSLAWLDELPADSDFAIAYQHPHFGPMTAGILLTSWAAHDLLHARQLVKRRFQFMERAGGEFGTDYAGEW